MRREHDHRSAHPDPGKDLVYRHDEILGADQRLLRQIFLWNAFYIILRGLFWGNLIGISLLLLQKYFGIVTLDSESYSIEVVPVYLNLGMILALNLGTALLNMLMLLIPSHFIARIRPAETAKYE